MRYLGGKSRLTESIYDLVCSVAPNTSSITDLFAGSGAVSDYFKRRGFAVTTNDLLFFSYATSRGTLAMNHKPPFSAVASLLGKDPIAHLNTGPLPPKDATQSIRLTYSPDSSPARMYLTSDNALRIDHARQQIDAWRDDDLLDDDEYFYILAAIISGVPYVSNITGTYGAFLKYWDKRAQNPYRLIEAAISNNRQTNHSYNTDAATLLTTVSGEVLYLDPPYNERQYLPNYHVLETVARYDSPKVSGVTGQRPAGSGKSEFCSKKTALNALEGVIVAAQFKHIILSYNNEGVIPTEALQEMLNRHAVPGTYELRTIPYRRYKNKIPNHTDGLEEQLYYIRKAGVA